MKDKLRENKIKSTLFSISVLILFSGCFLTSLLSSVINRATPRAILLLASAIVFFFLEKRKKRNRLPLLGIVLIILMLTIIGFGSLSVGDLEMEAIIRYAILYSIMLVAMNDKQWIGHFWRYAIVFALIYIVTTIWLSFDTASLFNYFGPNLYPEEHRFSYWVTQGYTPGITDHYSTNGMALANAVIIFASGMIGYMGEKEGKRYMVLLAISYVALFLTGKRAHLLFTIVAILLAVYVSQRYEKNRSLKYILLILVLMLIVGLAYMFVPQVSNMLDRFDGMEEDENITLRYMYWGAAYDSFMQNKIFGIGWLGFRNQVAPVFSYSGHCHNIYLQLLCETGIVGITVFVTWFIYALTSAIRFVCYVAKHKQELGSYFKTIALFSLMYQVYFLLYGMTGNPLYDTYVYPMYLIACIIPVYYSHNKREIRSW